MSKKSRFPNSTGVFWLLNKLKLLFSWNTPICSRYNCTHLPSFVVTSTAFNDFIVYFNLIWLKILLHSASLLSFKNWLSSNNLLSEIRPRKRTLWICETKTENPCKELQVRFYFGPTWGEDTDFDHDTLEFAQWSKNLNVENLDFRHGHLTMTNPTYFVR